MAKMTPQRARDDDEPDDQPPAQAIGLEDCPDGAARPVSRSTTPVISSPSPTIPPTMPRAA